MTGYTHAITRDRGTLLPTCLVLLSCFCFGTVPYFARTLTDWGMASYAVAFYRYGLSALILFPILLRLPAAQLKTAAWGVASGAAVGPGWIGYVSALKTVPVSTIGVLYMTYPVFTVIIGWFGLGEFIGPAQWFACLLITLAILITPARAARNLTTQMLLPDNKR